MNPKVDAFLFNLSPRRARNWARRQVQDFQAHREWKPGMYYLDHGSHPCVLIRMEDYDSLIGVSLVNGDVKGGCSIYHCGPEPTDEKTAWDLAKNLRNCKAGSHQFEKWADLGICKYCDEPEGGWPSEDAEQYVSRRNAWEDAIETKERESAK